MTWATAMNKAFASVGLCFIVVVYVASFFLADNEGYGGREYGWNAYKALPDRLFYDDRLGTVYSYGGSFSL
jgi:hypothetical protein